MSSVPGEVPAFDFDLEQTYYDHRQIADEVVWPLVDFHWNGKGEWKEFSKLSHELLIQKHGVRFGEEIEVTLASSHDLFEYNNPEADPVVISTATIEVDTVVYDERRDMVLKLARLAEAEIDEEDEAEIITKIGATYNFDTDHRMDIVMCQVVENIMGEVVWYSESDDYSEQSEDPEDEPDERPLIECKISDQDMDRLDTGIFILNSPEAIMRALHLIRVNPVTSN